MTTLTDSLREAWAQRAQDALRRLAAAEQAPALFKPEWTAGAAADYARAIRMLSEAVR